MAKDVVGVGKEAAIEETETGGRQSSLPYCPTCVPSKAFMVVSRILQEGIDAYEGGVRPVRGEENWRFIPQMDHLDHALSHIQFYLMGDDQEDHLGSAACRILFALEQRERGEGDGAPASRRMAKEAEL